MIESEAEKLKEGDRIKVKRDSYTAFNGQGGIFRKLMGVDDKKGRLALLDFPGIATISNCPSKHLTKHERTPINQRLAISLNLQCVRRWC